MVHMQSKEGYACNPEGYTRDQEGPLINSVLVAKAAAGLHSAVGTVSDCRSSYPASILYKSIAGRYRPVSDPDGPITARYRFIKNAYCAG